MKVYHLYKCVSLRPHAYGWNKHGKRYFYYTVIGFRFLLDVDMEYEGEIFELEM